MLTFSLQSGSNGNSIFVEAGDKRLLFDAGISGRQAALRMAARGRNIRDCDAVIISHEHGDHISGVSAYHRKFDLPIYATEATYRMMRRKAPALADVRRFVAGETIHFGDVVVHTIRTPHDAVDAVCFIVEHGGRRLGIFTDLGHPFDALSEAVGRVDAMYLESNYEMGLLEGGPYPPHLKQRIAGHRGHLSNEEAAVLTQRAGSGRLRWVALSHLSGENNEPELAVEIHRRHVGKLLPLVVASRTEVSEAMEV